MITANIKSYYKALGIIILMIYCFSDVVNAEVISNEDDFILDDNFLDLSIDELMDIPIVTSSNRQALKLNMSSAAITVITSEDIHYSGLTNIPDILQFYLGVDVVKLSRMRSAIGVRGLHDFVADRTLTLIDGRAADNPMFGGSEYYRYPVLVEDIERIEIMRGPGGAAWGANSFTGTINIITKKPDDTPSIFASTTFNEFGDIYNHIRWNSIENKLKWRISLGYEDSEDSDSAGAGKMYNSKPSLNSLMGFDNYKAQDFLRNSIIDSDFSYDYSDYTKITFGAAYAHTETGNWEFLGYNAEGNAWFETIRLYGKIDHEIDDESSIYLQWSGNFNNSKQASLLKWYSAENDIELQYNKKINKHNISLGGNYKFINISTDQQVPEQFNMHGAPFDETMAGIFLIDRYEATEDWTFEGQIRSDWYSGTHQDLSTRLSALYALDPDKYNILRFSFAKSFRSPFANLRTNQTSRIYHPILGTYLTNIKLGSGLENEETWSLEAGYSSQISESISFKTDAYFQQYDNLIGFESKNTVPVYYHPENINGADTWGIESELTYKTENSQVAVWYAYNDFQEDEHDQLFRAYKPAKHKAGIRGRINLTKDWILNANYRYNDTTPIGGDTTIFPVSMSHRLDLTFSRVFWDSNGEFTIGVADVLNKNTDASYTVGSLTSYETPGRYIFARIQCKF